VRMGNHRFFPAIRYNEPSINPARKVSITPVTP
jgi:hypothetical protein